MAEILSLSKARKAKARVAKEQTAAQNRVTFGRSKAERQLDEARDALETRRIDAHRVTTEDSEG
jgi:capsule polysaccharide export protein KpsE/RkpR